MLVVAEFAKNFGAQVLNSRAQIQGGLLILSQPEVLARDFLPLAYAAGYDSAIAFWQSHKINKPLATSATVD